jgi:osmotically-inducible protein OsmY
MTETDIRTRDAVVRQLDWDPEVDASAIGVTAGDGVVTLSGFIDTYAGKLAAERAAKHVRGVRAVANDIVVRLLVEHTDADIAHEAAQALRLMAAGAEHVQATVHNGHVTLTGTVEWLFQKQRAEKAMRHIRGLLGVFNHITVKPKALQRDVQRRVVRALHRAADIDAQHLSVTVKDDAVILRGTVASWGQRDAVERAAGSAPGITRLDNQITVVPAQPQVLEPPEEPVNHPCG